MPVDTVLMNYLASGALTLDKESHFHHKSHHLLWRHCPILFILYPSTPHRRWMRVTVLYTLASIFKKMWIADNLVLSQPACLSCQRQSRIRWVSPPMTINMCMGTHDMMEMISLCCRYATLVEWEYLLIKPKCLVSQSPPSAVTDNLMK